MILGMTTCSEWISLIFKDRLFTDPSYKKICKYHDFKYYSRGTRAKINNIDDFPINEIKLEFHLYNKEGEIHGHKKTNQTYNERFDNCWRWFRDNIESLKFPEDSGYSEQYRSIPMSNNDFELDIYGKEIQDPKKYFKLNSIPGSWVSTK
eukprot:Mrub_12586.p1 GENE.Mrub_12586~~Mrub_12586.p1  ORF type:complete len:175 (+),score=16.83 Mrub_12586:77-526(+)